VLWKVSARPIAGQPSAAMLEAVASESAAAVDVDRLNAEHRTLLEGCGLLDRSERGKLALTGPGAIDFLDGQVTNELGGLRPGDGCYAAFLTHKGKMLGDLRILAVGPDPDGSPRELLLDTERVALQALFDMIRRFKVGYDLELHKRTLERGLISLIGPEADRIAHAGGLAAVEHAHELVELDGIQARAVRADVGIDLICETAEAERLTAALQERGAAPVGEAAAECLRIEGGRPRYGVDLDETVIPQEAGLNERAVSFTKGCYVGQETVARLHYRGKPNRHLRGLRLSEPGAPGEEIRLGQRPVGRLASVAVSPELGPIALALVRREAAPGSTVAVGERGATAEVVELPFASAGRRAPS
jgi:folate-binding protein YgfZ